MASSPDCEIKVCERRAGRQLCSNFFIEKPYSDVILQGSDRGEVFYTRFRLARFEQLASLMAPDQKKSGSGASVLKLDYPARILNLVVNWVDLGPTDGSALLADLPLGDQIELIRFGNRYLPDLTSECLGRMRLRRDDTYAEVKELLTLFGELKINYAPTIVARWFRSRPSITSAVLPPWPSMFFDMCLEHQAADAGDRRLQMAVTLHRAIAPAGALVEAVLDDLKVVKCKNRYWQLLELYRGGTNAARDRWLEAFARRLLCGA